MDLTLSLRKLMKIFIETENVMFDINVEKSINYLNNLPEPKNDSQRSYYQYKCTMFRLSFMKRIMLEIAAILLIYPYYLKLRTEKSSFEKKYDAVFMTEGISINTLPVSLRKEFPKIKELGFGVKMTLDKYDRNFLKKCFKEVKFNYYYKLKLIMKLGMYSSIIKRYNPKVIISYTESSFTSSILTMYCEEKGVENISIMHGERLFMLKLAFFRFSRYYLWDEHYIKLFAKLRANANKFIIEVPEHLKKLKLNKKENYKYFATFYLQEESKEALLALKKACSILKNNNKNCAFRLHPRALNHMDVKSILGEFDIQDFKTTSLEESLNSTEYVVSCFSTVLYEAWYLGKEIIIDDYSQPKNYNMLTSLDYIMLSKPHHLLSQIVQGYEQGENL